MSSTSGCSSPCRRTRKTKDKRLCDPDTLNVKTGKCRVLPPDDICGSAPYWSLSGDVDVDLSEGGLPGLQPYCFADDAKPDPPPPGGFTTKTHARQSRGVRRCRVSTCFLHDPSPIVLGLILYRFLFDVDHIQRRIHLTLNQTIDAVISLIETHGDVTELERVIAVGNNPDNAISLKSWLEDVKRAPVKDNAKLLYIFDALTQTNESLEPLMWLLRSAPDHVQDIIGGAHIILPTEYYHQIERLQKSYARMSSHYPTSSQLQLGLTITVPALGGEHIHILTGMLPDGKRAWAQVEAAPAPRGASLPQSMLSVLGEPATRRSFIEHVALDFTMHKFSGEQVGSLGLTSPQSEKKGAKALPLEIAELRGPRPEMARTPQYLSSSSSYSTDSTDSPRSADGSGSISSALTNVATPTTPSGLLF
jgi:hypothetical protein